MENKIRCKFLCSGVRRNFVQGPGGAKYLTHTADLDVLKEQGTAEKAFFEEGTAYGSMALGGVLGDLFVPGKHYMVTLEALD